MALSIIRFDMRTPGMSPPDAQRLYATALDMAEWADQRAFDLLVLSEHHGTEDGFLPSPLVLGGAIAGRTQRIPMNVAALLLPLHDPVRIAEDIAVLDLVSGGRISLVVGLGYRRVEYDLFDRVWSKRGARMDECLDVLLKAWTGEPFEYRGTTVRVTPRPLQQPHPTLMVGGSGEAAARRAARFGLGFFPSIGDDHLADVYRQECRARDQTPGLVMMPTPDMPGTVVVAEDPDAAWARHGPYLLHDAVTYRSWQQKDSRSLVLSDAVTIDDLRAEGVYRIVTPDEAVVLAHELGPMGAFTMHPLCGGTPPDLAWESLELFGEQVLPRLVAGI